MLRIGIRIFSIFEVVGTVWAWLGICREQKREWERE